MDFFQSTRSSLSSSVRRRDMEKEPVGCEVPVSEDSEVYWIEGLDENPMRRRRRMSSEVDRRDMQRMGKQQQLPRKFRELSAIGFTSCVMGTWEILLTASHPGLLNGGLAGIFWSMVWATIGQFFVLLSLAEMSSMAPTAGGHFHWISELAPPRWQRLLSYSSGWLSTISWQGFFAIDCYMMAGIIQELIHLYEPVSAPTRWQVSLLTIAMALVITIFNAFGARHLSIAEGVFATCRVFIVVPIVVTLWVLGPTNSGSDVFFTFSDNGAGWPSPALSILVGQLPSIFVVLRSDCVVHIAEEVEAASLIVPRCMIWSYLLNVPLTFAMLVAYLFSITSIADIKNSATPFVRVFQNTMGSDRAALTFSIIILVLMAMVTISTMASTSRQLFAFARDQGLPFSDWISTINPRDRVPVNAMIVTAVFAIAISFTYMGSTVAFNALLSLSTVSLMATYIIALTCIILRRVHGEQMPPARWSLGRAGLLINSLGLLYSCWALFWSVWPSHYHVTAGNFNWSGLLFVALVAFALVLYHTGGKKRYEGPVVYVQGREFGEDP